MPGARLVKSSRTLAAASLPQAAARGAAAFLAGEDAAAKEVVAGLIRDVGFTPVDLGGWAEVPIIEVGGALSGLGVLRRGRPPDRRRPQQRPERSGPARARTEGTAAA